MSIDFGGIVNESGRYIVPVEWTMASTVAVEADNLQQAIAIAEELLDDIPLDVDPEYVDGSYRIAIDNEEDVVATQSYQHNSGIVIDRDKNIIHTIL